MSARAFFGDGAKSGVKRTIEGLERECSAEVVVSVVPSSGNYRAADEIEAGAPCTYYVVETWYLSRSATHKCYDSITVRVFARSLDYTLNASGQVVSGSRSVERPYSEYWTLIRGSAVRGAPRLDPSCPNCGAPLDINMAGSCNHCRAEVTSGNFDWVLSRIEQDDDY